MKIINRITICAIIIALLFNLTACGSQQKALTWQEQYDLGERYLSEGNYEEAIIAFMAAIEIDPKQVEIYLALADTYISMGEPENAIQILTSALDIVEDISAIQPKLDELEQYAESSTDISVASEDQKNESVISTEIPKLESDTETGAGSERELEEEQASDPESASLTLSDKNIDMYMGNTYQLHAYGAPQGVDVKWSINMPLGDGGNYPISVDQNGKISTLPNQTGYPDSRVEEATITVSYTYNGKVYTEDCIVRANYPSISLRDGIGSTDLAIGETYSINPTANFPNAVFRYQTLYGDSVTVDANGIVTAVHEGNTEILVSAQFYTEKGHPAGEMEIGDGGGTLIWGENEYASMVWIDVWDPSYVFASDYTTKEVGNYLWISSSYLVDDLVCASDNISVMAPVSNGELEAVGIGTATVTATWSYKGVSYSDQIVVEVTE